MGEIAKPSLGVHVTVIFSEKLIYIDMVDPTVYDQFAVIQFTVVTVGAILSIVNALLVSFPVFPAESMVRP